VFRLLRVTEFVMAKIFEIGCLRVVPAEPVRDLTLHAVRRIPSTSIYEFMVSSPDLEGADCEHAWLNITDPDWATLPRWDPVFKREGDDGVTLCLDSLVFKIAGIVELVDKWAESVDDVVFQRVIRGRLQDPEVRAWLESYKALPSLPRAD
jgi:hypothetical protein